MWFYIEKCETMEKLLELMNDYAHTYADHYDDTGAEITITFFSHTDNCFQYACDGGYETLVDDVVISKRYWFVWWLIENKKLKSYRAYKDFIHQNYIEFDGWVTIPSVNWQLYDSILCWLAIQDNPIDFLISILL